MKAVIYETGEYAPNKAQAIELARRYLDRHPDVNDVCVCYGNPDRHEWGEIWFIAGRKNTEGIVNFVEVA